MLFVLVLVLLLLAACCLLPAAAEAAAPEAAGGAAAADCCLCFQAFGYKAPSTGKSKKRCPGVVVKTFVLI